MAQRLGFNYDGLKAIDKCSLKTILKKRKRIKSIEIDCYIDGKVLEIFAKFSSQLESLEVEAIRLNEEKLLEFDLKYGHRLKRLKLINSSH